MRPCVGLRNLVSRLKQVVLPAPLGPINAWIVPRSTRRLTSRTATKPANSLVRPSVSRTMSLAIERANSPLARLGRKLCGKGPGAGMPSRPIPPSGVRSSPPGPISTALVADEPEREPIDAHVMPREQKMHRELIAGRDPPDQRLVRCGLHPGVSALVAAAEDRVQNGEPGGGARARTIGCKSTRLHEGRAWRPNRRFGPAWASRD